MLFEYKSSRSSCGRVLPCLAQFLCSRTELDITKISFRYRAIDLDIESYTLHRTYSIAIQRCYVLCWWIFAIFFALQPHWFRLFLNLPFASVVRIPSISGCTHFSSLWCTAKLLPYQTNIRPFCKNKNRKFKKKKNRTSYCYTIENLKCKEINLEFLELLTL